MKQIEDMNLTEMLVELNTEVIKDCLVRVRSGELEKGELGSIITLLKNNKIVEDKKIDSEADLIDELVDEI